MFKIFLTEKTIKNNKKLTIESKVVLYKNDFIFLFNRNIKKINKHVKNNKRIYIITFCDNITNSNIYHLNYYYS